MLAKRHLYRLKKYIFIARTTAFREREILLVPVR